MNSINFRYQNLSPEPERRYPLNRGPANLHQPFVSPPGPYHNRRCSVARCVQRIGGQRRGQHSV